MSNGGAEKLLASVIEGDGADVPIAADELGRITLPLVGVVVTEADAHAIGGYAALITAAAGIIVDPGTNEEPYKSAALELVRTCTNGIAAIVAEHTTATLESAAEGEQTT